MAQLALEIQNSAPQDPLLPAASVIPSSYTTALDTVRFCVLGIGDEGPHLIANAPLDTACGNISGICRVVEEDTRVADALRCTGYTESFFQKLYFYTV